MFTETSHNKLIVALAAAMMIGAVLSLILFGPVGDAATTAESTDTAVIRRIVLILMLFTAAILAGAGAAMWYMLNVPLHRLLHEVQQVRYGESVEKITSGPGPIGRLAHEFRLLHTALLGSRKNCDRAELLVEKRVADRTRKLDLTVRQLEKTACTDKLTGLANRRHLGHHLVFMFEQARMLGSDLSCLMIDVDNFKNVNDTFGHAVGDEVIAFVGQLMRAGIRDGDFAARYGGDEFVLLLKNTDRKNAHCIAQRLRKLFAREVKSLIPSTDRTAASQDADQADLYPMLSIGIASITAGAPHDAHELIRMADRALYRAKKAGRNCVAQA